MNQLCTEHGGPRPTTLCVVCAEELAADEADALREELSRLREERAEMLEALRSMLHLSLGEVAMRHRPLFNSEAEWQAWLSREYPTILQARAILLKVEGK